MYVLDFLEDDLHRDAADIETENRGVHSSILCLGTLGQESETECGRSTAVVRLLAKEKVVGSNPIARSSDCGLMIDDCQSTIRNLQSGT